MQKHIALTVFALGIALVTFFLLSFALFPRVPNMDSQNLLVLVIGGAGGVLALLGGKNLTAMRTSN